MKIRMGVGSEAGATSLARLIVVSFLLLLSNFRLHAQNLYGLRFVSGTIRVFSMDPGTGTTTQVADTGLTSASIVGDTFDPIGRRYFFIRGSGPDNLVIVNVSNGSTSELPNALAQNQFDPVTGLLYGLRFVSGTVRVFAMDPNTGTTTQVAEPACHRFPSQEIRSIRSGGAISLSPAREISSL